MSESYESQSPQEPTELAADGGRRPPAGSAARCPDCHDTGWIGDQCAGGLYRNGKRTINDEVAPCGCDAAGRAIRNLRNRVHEADQFEVVLWESLERLCERNSKKIDELKAEMDAKREEWGKAYSERCELARQLHRAEISQNVQSSATGGAQPTSNHE